MTPPTAQPERRRGLRANRLVLGACAVAALILFAGTSGTLSSWTQAIITNSTNTAATGGAVVLQEVGPDGTAAHTSQTCRSSDVASNSSTCTTINKYGGTTTPLLPNASLVSTVTFTNIGQATASSFQLAPGACSQTPVASAGVVANLCTGGDLTVAISCSNGATYNAGAAWTDLVYLATNPGSLATKTHTATLAPGAQWTCRFTVSLIAAASVQAQGITVSQPLTWNLVQ